MGRPDGTACNCPGTFGRKQTAAEIALVERACSQPFPASRPRLLLPRLTHPMFSRAAPTLGYSLTPTEQKQDGEEPNDRAQDMGHRWRRCCHIRRPGDCAE